MIKTSLPVRKISRTHLAGVDPKQQEALHIRPCNESSSKTEEIIRPSVHVSTSVSDKTIHIIKVADHFGDDIKLANPPFRSPIWEFSEYGGPHQKSYSIALTLYSEGGPKFG